MGAMRGALMRGWMGIAADDLGVHRISLNRAMKLLEAQGFVRQLKKGTHLLLTEAFDSEADPSRVKVRRP